VTGVSLVPVILGAGIPWFAGAEGPVRLSDPDVVRVRASHLRYHVRRPRGFLAGTDGKDGGPVLAVLPVAVVPASRGSGGSVGGWRPARLPLRLTAAPEGGDPGG
jgi:hypothetical protein